MTDEEPYSLKELKFSFDISKAHYELDALQNKLLETYIRADLKFRRAFSQNYTPEFLQFLQDKARLREPVHISIMGNTRGGKSVTAITIASFIMGCYGKHFTIDYICGNAVEFLEKLRNMPEDKLINSCFLIDEQKTEFGYGSYAKKMNLQDVNSIIALNNLSTIMINPLTWADKNCNYGIRVFGRDFNTFTTRSMLYNTQAGGKGGETPMGNLYLPIFTHFLPQPYASLLEQQYLEKKKEWIGKEMRGENDALAELRKKSAESFCRDKIYIQIKKKKERLAYITNKLGSSWTSKECEDIETLTSLLRQGFLNSEEE